MYLRELQYATEMQNCSRIPQPCFASRNTCRLVTFRAEFSCLLTGPRSCLQEVGVLLWCIQQARLLTCPPVRHDPQLQSWPSLRLSGPRVRWTSLPSNQGVQLGASPEPHSEPTEPSKDAQKHCSASTFAGHPGSPSAAQVSCLPEPHRKISSCTGDINRQHEAAR